jgi:deazaflavin-dependent oxidoreductase (nitroreductase family)
MSVPGVPQLLLTHRGAKSGRSYTTPLLYFNDGPDDVVLVASNYGRERHPAWLANVRANSEVVLRARGHGGRYRARVLDDGPDRERLFATAKRFTRAYESYERRTARRIRVVVCTPLDAP